MLAILQSSISCVYPLKSKTLECAKTESMGLVVPMTSTITIYNGDSLDNIGNEVSVFYRNICTGIGHWEDLSA